MTKTFISLLFGVALCGQWASATAQEPISFGIDCMIHDLQGAMVADLGMVGAMMNGQYMSDNKFPYKEVTIEASLAGPFAEAPEVAAPQLRLTVVGPKGLIAQAVTSANPDFNMALYIPGENVYLHCDKMAMGGHH